MKGGSFPVFLADDRGKYQQKESPVARAKRSLKLQHHVQFIFFKLPGGNSWEFLVGVCRPVLEILTSFPGALPYLSHIGMCRPKG